ncbi:DUF2971 domain-containing protein [Thalassospira lucentensis]|uniref:DUF2971 domain-containing protein n=1 Tax=Thalassospira lucentensis TaxID=168935 RepID=UPI003D2EC289
MEDLDAEWDKVPSYWNNKRVHFFKYISSDTAKIVLQNRTLRWSCPELLDDALEMKFQVFAEEQYDKLKEKYLDRLWLLYNSGNDVVPDNRLGEILQIYRDRVSITRDELHRELGEEFDETMNLCRKHEELFSREITRMLKRTKVLCLTIRPDNNLMWALYAQGHSGIVLRFRSSPDVDSVFGTAMPVFYSEQVPVLYSEDTLIDVLTGLRRIAAKDIFRRIVTTKSSDWEYQQEWRIDGGFGREPDAKFEDFQFSPYELDGVIFGSKFPAENQKKIRDLCEHYPCVKFFKAVISDKEFGIRIDSLE